MSGRDRLEDGRDMQPDAEVPVELADRAVFALSAAIGLIADRVGSPDAVPGKRRRLGRDDAVVVYDAERGAEDDEREEEARQRARARRGARVADLSEFSHHQRIGDQAVQLVCGDAIAREDCSLDGGGWQGL